MFVNISNHRFEHWSKEQIKEAKRIGGEIVDFGLPYVDPTFGKYHFNEFVLNTLSDIHSFLRKNSACDREHSILVQGERVLTHRIVIYLKSFGYNVVCATSERDVVESVKTDGSTEKKVIFKFVQFRSY